MNTLKSDLDTKNAVSEMFATIQKELPVILGINFAGDDIVLYKLEKTRLNEKGIEKFVENFINGGKNDIMTISETIQVKNRSLVDNIHVFVGSNFKKNINTIKKDILVFIDRPNTICRKYYHHFKNLSNLMKNSSLEFAKIDFSVNEIPEFKINSIFPKLLLFLETK